MLHMWRDLAKMRGREEVDYWYAPTSKNYTAKSKSTKKRVLNMILFCVSLNDIRFNQSEDWKPFTMNEYYFILLSPSLNLCSVSQLNWICKLKGFFYNDYQLLNPSVWMREPKKHTFFWISGYFRCKKIRKFNSTVSLVRYRMVLSINIRWN